MKDERGITLVELLAVLALLGIIMTLIITVFINGTRATERSTTNQRLQQEANYIVEAIRMKYLESKDESFELHIENQSLKMGEATISEGYDYMFFNDEEKKTIVVERKESVNFELRLKKGKLEYKVKTIFSKLR